MAGYRHTQHGPMWWLLALFAVAALAGAQWLPDRELAWVFAAAAVVFVLLAATVARLTVQDGGDSLLVRFGPLRLWGTRVPYDGVVAVARARSKLIDGWGVHWLPGRGWTYNLSGRDCVEVRTRTRRLRIGTDDAEGLLGFLVERTGVVAGDA